MFLFSQCHLSATQPLSRFFHSAALIKDTMVIVGGRTEEEDYSNSVSLYQINCNTWIHPGGFFTRLQIPNSDPYLTGPHHFDLFP